MQSIYWTYDYYILSVLFCSLWHLWLRCSTEVSHVPMSWFPGGQWPGGRHLVFSPRCPPCVDTGHRQHSSPAPARPPATLTLLPTTIETSGVHLWVLSGTSISCYGLSGPMILYSGANSSSFSSKSNRVLTETRILCLGLSLPLLLILVHCVCSS